MIGKSLVALIALAVTQSAFAGTLYLNPGETAQFGATQVVCGGANNTGSTFDVSSSVDLTCYQTTWKSAASSFLDFDSVLSTLSSCRSGQIEPSKCIVVSSKGSGECQSLALQSFTSSFFSNEQSAKVAEACKSVQAKCSL